MTTSVPVAVQLPSTGGDATYAWRRHGFFLAALSACVLAIFARDVGDLVSLWWTSTTFGHCLFIPPVLGWLVWQRRTELARLTPVAWLPGLAVVAIGGMGWLTGDAAGVALARQLGIVIMLQGLVVTMLGPQVARGLIFPLAYAVFLVPFGESIEGPLQAVTVRIVMALLPLVGVPAVANGVLITIPNGYFEVAEACSGAKFVLAMLAFGVLVGNVCFNRWRHRAAFLGMALVVAVVANGLRAFGTIYAASLTSVELATGVDHIVYGWVFFALVMAAVVAIGWRWFDRDPDAPAFDPEALPPVGRGTADALVAAVAALFVIIAAPAYAHHVDARTDTLPAQLALPEVPGWHRVSLSTAAPWAPHYPGADHFLIGRYANDRGEKVDMAVAVYAGQHEGKEVVGFGIGALSENDRWVRIRDLAPIDGGRAIEITAPGPVRRVVATWYRVAGATTASDRTVKLLTLRARLLGVPQRAVALHLSAEALPGQDAAQAIAHFAAGLGPIGTAADRLTEPAR